MNNYAFQVVDGPISHLQLQRVAYVVTDLAHTMGMSNMPMRLRGLGLLIEGCMLEPFEMQSKYLGVMRNRNLERHILRLPLASNAEVILKLLFSKEQLEALLK